MPTDGAPLAPGRDPSASSFDSENLCRSGNSTKTSHRLDLPMGSFIHDLLVARHAIGVEGPFVFPSPTSKSVHIEDARDTFTEIEAAIGIWVSSHVVQRAFVTTAESLPAPLGANNFTSAMESKLGAHRYLNRRHRLRCCRHHHWGHRHRYPPRRLSESQTE